MHLPQIAAGVSCHGCDLELSPSPKHSYADVLSAHDLKEIRSRIREFLRRGVDHSRLPVPIVRADFLQVQSRFPDSKFIDATDKIADDVCLAAEWHSPVSDLARAK